MHTPVTPPNATSQPSNTETVHSRLILTRNGISEVLLVIEGSHLSLPRVELPKWERPAPHLVAHAREQWQLDAIGLFAQQTVNGVSELAERFYVLESRQNSGSPPEGVVWYPIVGIDHAPLPSVTDSSVLEAAISQVKMYERGQGAGTFARSGWFEELSTWIQSHLTPLGLKLSGQWSQYSISPSYCLVRYETNGPKVWFKAVGDPREYTITTKLAELCPAHLPTVIATRPDLRGWLAFEAKGRHLNEIGDLEDWKAAACSLAALQLETAASSDALIAAGCADLRLTQLRDLIEPFLQVVAELMTRQPSCPPRILGRQDLQVVERKLKFACQRLEAFGLPETLGNADLNPGNILVSQERTVFIDWMHGNISHPLIALEHLLAIFRRLRPALGTWEQSIRDAYSLPWRKLASSETLASACQLTPLVAAFAFAVGCTGWRDGLQTATPNLAKLMRALGRRMHEEAQRISA